ncbi:MAG: EAL domain-containing protein [Gammaproteobacteria bacterium]|nr:EAL domain-containing protein [Gammaproteobacteria bacterium]
MTAASDHDPRSRLPTRPALVAELRARPPGAAPLLAAVHVDVCNFDLLNFICGSAATDRFLQDLARTLSAAAGDDARLAHAWSDEFDLVFEAGSPADALARVEALRGALNAMTPPEAARGMPVLASFGVALAPAGADVEALLHKAQFACREARHQGTNRIHLLMDQDDSATSLREQMKLGARLLQMIANREFCLHAQPIFYMSGAVAQRVAKVEILLRQRTERGDVPVSRRTVEVAERYGFVRALDEFVLEQALAWFRAHPETLARLDRFNINLSGRSLSDRGFHDFLVQKVCLGGVPPDKLCFEITETSLVGSLKDLRALILELRQLGCSVALDDFGVGLCSFGYLQELPVDEIKIDGSFVQRMATDPVAEQIVTALKAVADATGKRTVAEFVDNRTALDLLQKLGVHYLQGWLFAKAMPLDELPRYLERFRPQEPPAAARPSGA